MPRASDAEFRMWDYWRDKYGPMQAMEEYYPSLIGPNSDRPGISFAYQQAKNALFALDHHMTRLAEDEEDGA